MVKKNGRGIMPNCLEGKVLTNTGEPYLVRIDRYEELNNVPYRFFKEFIR